MTRAAILALLVLTGCTTDRIPVDRETVAAHELVGFDWCGPAQLHQCAMIRDRNQMFLMQTPSRYGDETMNLWAAHGVIVEAFSEDD